MTISKTKKLGAILALAIGLAAPVMAAMPADAATIRVETVQVMHGPKHVLPVRYEHRGEVGYRDLHWREARFHRHHVFERHEIVRAHFGR
jgi:hypothetical protein